MRLSLLRAGRRIRWSALGRAYRRFGPYVLRYRGSLLVAFLCLLGSMGTTILQPLPLKFVIDRVLTGSSPQSADAAGGGIAVRVEFLVAICAAVIAIAVLAGLFTYGQRLLTARVAQRALTRIRRDVFAHVQRLPLSYHGDQKRGDLIMRMTGDIQMLREILVHSVMRLAGQGFVIAGMVGMMLWLSPLLTLVAVAVLPAMALVMFRFTGPLRDATRRQRRKEGRVAALITETIHSISVVHSFATHRREDERMAAQNRASLRAGLRATRLEERMSRWVEIVVAAGTCGVLALGTVLAQRGALTVGTLVVFLSYVRGFYKPLRELSRVWTRLSKASICAERILDLLEIEPQVRDLPGAVIAPGFRGAINLTDVVLRYPGRDRPALDHLSLQVDAGEAVLLTGHSGAGKTSLARLVLRLWDPTSGTVRIDGRDVREFTLESLRERIAVVPQETILFGASVRDNIAYGCPGATEDEIETAARRVFAHEFIERLPGGYDSVIGESGVTLSGGERQRLALARAAIKKAPILILDEPATGLDERARWEVTRGLRALMASCTTVVISHHPELLVDVDRIIGLEGGRLVDERPGGPGAAGASLEEVGVAATRLGHAAGGEPWR